VTRLVGAGAASGVPLVVTVAVLGAAVLHAAWNALAKSVQDHLVGFVALVLAAGAVALAAAPFAEPPGRDAAPYLGASVVLQCTYQAFLLQSYRLGEFNQVYPIARGTAPIVVALVAVPAADERLGGVRLLGLLAVAGGLFALASLRTWWTAGRPPALLFAVGTGVLIASYSVVDGLGVRHADSSLGYVAWLTVAQGLPIPVFALVWRRERLRDGWAASWRPAALGGALSLAAYAIVLWAQTRGSLGAVAALRETSVLVAALIGAALFGESFGRRRILAAASVAVGVVLLNVG
jgi:drug/metabolite transporter (DMT)-like permease